MFENVDGRTDGQTDGRTDDGVTGILLAHPWAFGSGELKIHNAITSLYYKMNLARPCYLSHEPRREKTCLQEFANNTAQTSLHIRPVWSAPLWFFFWKYHMLTCYRWKFNFLASLCSCWGDWFETCYVKNPEDRFSHEKVHIMIHMHHTTLQFCMLCTVSYVVAKEVLIFGQSLHLLPKFEWAVKALVNVCAFVGLSEPSVPVNISFKISHVDYIYIDENCDGMLSIKKDKTVVITSMCSATLR